MSIIAKQITEYELLISCPTDVQNELDVINECVNVFNNIFGSVNNAKIVTRHWLKDSYPQSGGKPQKILNNQLVMQCDAAVAVFWTRFGTPTDEYGSGTEEEIEELIKSGKQVFLYFSDCPIAPSEIDNDQYEQVKIFRGKYNGYYWSYPSIDEFEKDFLNHLTLYFVNILNGDRQEKPSNYKSNLCLKGIVDGKLINEAIPLKPNFSKGKYLEEKIIELINQIERIHIPETKPNKSTEISENHTIDSSIFKGNLKTFSNIDPRKLSEAMTTFYEKYPSQEIIISSENQEKINKFFKDHDIKLNQSFYFLGNLIKKNMNIGLNSSNNYYGPEESKEKYKLIGKLETLINEYYARQKYLLAIDRKIFIKLALCNIGTDFDEDIDVWLYFKKGCISLPNSLPFPDFECIKMAIGTFEKIYKPEKTVIIDEYPDYFYQPLPSLPTSYYNILGGKSHEEMIHEKTDEFNIIRDRVFCYEIHSNNEYDIFRYNQKYLKQNSNCFLPSYLIFNEVPSVIHYEITAKRSPNVIKDQIIVEHNGKD
ncbi:MAG: hypothetical protein ABFD08_17695 [Syntrophomonas sp.]